MRLVRHGPPGAEKPGALDIQGQVRDLSLLIDDLTPKWLAPERLKALAAVDLNKMPIVQDARMGPPVAGIGQFIGIGLNYRQHALEAGVDVPQEPIVFMKALGAIAGPNDAVVIPAGCQSVDWEIELGVVIGTEARNVAPDDALSHVAGYVLANDISERDWQLNRSGQWGKGKSFDGFGPIGPWLVTKDDIEDPQNLALELSVNGQVRQKSSTADMIFSVAEIVSYLSRFMTLRPGDLVITGTPQGVALGMKTPAYLQTGDVMTLSAGPLGTQSQVVVRSKE